MNEIYGINIEDSIKQLSNKFNEIKAMGWIKSVQAGKGGIGRTFESLISKEYDNLEFPDYEGIEIKTKRAYSLSYTTLFSMKPEGKYYHEVERLKDKYGYPDSILKQFNVLNNSIYAHKRTWIGFKYQFMLDVDYKLEKIFLCVFDVHGNLIEKDVYWDFDTIKEKLYRKLQIVAFIMALHKFYNKNEYFKYYNMKIYKLKDFATFLKLVEDGTIRINFKISVYRNGLRIGQVHDHGTSFNIMEKDFYKLYSDY